MSTPETPGKDWTGAQLIGAVCLAGAAGGAVAWLGAAILTIAEGKGLADGLSSLCNVITAVVAVMAFHVARSWLPQLTTQEGYKEAISLVNEHFIWLGLQNPLQSEAGVPMTCFNELKNSITACTYGEYELKINALELAMLNEKKRKDAMEQVRFRMRTYGLCDSLRYGKRLAAMNAAFTASFDAAVTLTNKLREDLDIQRRYINISPLDADIAGKTEALQKERSDLAVSVEETYKKRSCIQCVDRVIAGSAHVL